MTNIIKSPFFQENIHSVTTDFKREKRKPSFIRVKAPQSQGYHETLRVVRDKNLHTVCEEAACPNIGECWTKKHATFLIMGDICTRACRFCNISTGKPRELDSEEPQKVAESIALLSLKHSVVTSVDRDDLSDGGALHFAETVKCIRIRNPHTTIEILTPDFRGIVDPIQYFKSYPPDVFNHNLETVPRLYSEVRPGARYYNSLRLLEKAKDISCDIFTKSGIMVGLGETKKEVYQIMDDLRMAGVDFLTIGQYLQPTLQHWSVHEYITEDVFKEYKDVAYNKGFLMVSSSPLTRSSYHADSDFVLLKEKRKNACL